MQMLNRSLGDLIQVRAQETRVITISCLSIAFLSCSTVPDCALATPDEGWQIVDPSQYDEFNLGQISLAAGEGYEWIWVQHENGGFAYCTRRSGDKYCSGLLEIPAANPDENVLIMCH